MTGTIAPPVPVTPATSAAPPGSGTQSTGPAPPGPPFGQVLSTARTADAEGPQGSGTKPGDRIGSKSTPPAANVTPVDLTPPIATGAIGAPVAAVTTDVTAAASSAMAAFSTAAASSAAASSGALAGTGAAASTGAAGSAAAALGSSTAGQAPPLASLATLTGDDSQRVLGNPSLATPATAASVPATRSLPSTYLSTAGPVGAGTSTATPSGTTATGSADPAAAPTNSTATTAGSQTAAQTASQTAAQTAAPAAATVQVAAPTTGQTASATTAEAASATTAQAASATSPQAVAGGRSQQPAPRPATHPLTPATAPVKGATTATGANTSAPTAAPSTQTAAAGRAGAGGRGDDRHPWSADQRSDATAAIAQDGQDPDTTTAGSDSATPAIDGTPGSTATAAISQTAAKDRPRSSVSLQDAVDAVQATVTAAARAGLSQARISLSPQTLGGLRISLTQTADGLVARVSADHPDALTTLQQSAGDLRRSLESTGLALLRLDIGTTGEQGAGSSGDPGGPGSGAGSTASGGSADAHGEADDTSLTGTTMRVELSNGSLINVLA
jgi:flagellar hook-length control protein FliK